MTAFSSQTGLQAARRKDLGKSSANREKLRGNFTLSLWNRQLKEYSKNLFAKQFSSSGCNVPCDDDVRRGLLGIHRGKHHQFKHHDISAILTDLYQAFLFWFLDDLGAKKLDMGWTVRLLYLFLMQFFLLSLSLLFSSTSFQPTSNRWRLECWPRCPSSSSPARSRTRSATSTSSSSACSPTLQDFLATASLRSLLHTSCHCQQQQQLFDFLLTIWYHPKF